MLQSQLVESLSRYLGVGGSELPKQQLYSPLSSPGMKPNSLGHQPDSATSWPCPQLSVSSPTSCW